jgi:hypothetical protein
MIFMDCRRILVKPYCGKFFIESVIFLVNFGPGMKGSGQEVRKVESRILGTRFPRRERAAGR